MEQFQVTLLRVEHTRHYKTIRANSVFEAFDKARAEFEEPFHETGGGNGYGVQVDDVKPVKMKGESHE